MDNPVAPPTPVTLLTLSQPQKSGLPLLLTILLLLALTATSLLVYQNWLLQRQIAALQVQLSLTPTPQILVPPTDPTANWKTYTDPQKLFIFKYPDNYSLTTFSTRQLLNRKIVWYEVARQPGQSCSDCPVQESIEAIKLPFVDATKISGYAGEIGGGIAQSYVVYEIKVPRTDRVVIFELWELPQNLTEEEIKLYPPGRIIGTISSSEIAIFDQILSTFKFTDQTVDTSNWKTYTNQVFAFNYPKNFTVQSLDNPIAAYAYFLPEKLIHINRKNSYPKLKLETNFTFAVSKSTEITSSGDCYRNPQGNIPLTTSIIFNGITYYSGTSGGGGGGTNTSSKVYRTMNHGTCFEISLTYAESSDWNEPGVREQSWQESKEGFDILNKILSTFQFTN